MSITIILSIIVVHYIADFIFQDEKWALGKSKNWNDLLVHTITYSFIFAALSYFIAFGYLFITKETLNTKIELIYWFIPITFVCHTITDYFTSRWVGKKFKDGYYGSSIPNFGAFSSIGFDQVLHYFQLFLTFYFLNQ